MSPAQFSWVTLSAGSSSTFSFPHNCRPRPLDCIGLVFHLGQAVCSALRPSQHSDQRPILPDLGRGIFIRPSISLASTSRLTPSTTSPSTATNLNPSALPPRIRTQHERAPSRRVLQHQTPGTSCLHSVCGLVFSVEGTLVYESAESGRWRKRSPRYASHLSS